MPTRLLVSKKRVHALINSIREYARIIIILGVRAHIARGHKSTPLWWCVRRPATAIRLQHLLESTYNLCHRHEHTCARTRKRGAPRAALAKNDYLRTGHTVTRAEQWRGTSGAQSSGWARAQQPRPRRPHLPARGKEEENRMQVEAHNFTVRIRNYALKVRRSNNNSGSVPASGL